MGTPCSQGRRVGELKLGWNGTGSTSDSTHPGQVRGQVPLPSGLLPASQGLHRCPTARPPAPGRQLAALEEAR